MEEATVIDIILTTFVLILLIWQRKNLIDFFKTTKIPLFFWGLFFLSLSGALTLVIEPLLHTPILRHFVYSTFSLFLFSGGLILKEVSMKGFH